MLKNANLLLLMWVAIFATSNCGGAGQRSGEKPKAKPKGKELPKGETTSNVNQTSVGLTLIGDDLPRLSGCGRPLAIPKLVVVDDFILDGRVEEWSEEQLFLRDPSGDANDNDDLTSASLALAADSESWLIGNIAGDIAFAPSFLQLTLGRLAYTDEETRRIEAVSQRTYRFAADGRVEEKRDGLWTVLERTTAAWHRGADGIEWRIARRQVDEVLFQDMWFHQYELVGSTGVLLDQTAKRYVLAVDANASTDFRIETCASEQSRKVPMAFQQISHPAIGKDEAEAFFGIARLAYESLQQAWVHQLWPTELLTIVLSESRPVGDHPELAVGVDQRLYDGVFVTWNKAIAESLAVGRYADIYTEIQSALLTAFLKYHRLNANAGELAWAVSTIEQWSQRRFLGYSSWLDRLPILTQNFRAEPDNHDTAGIRARFDRLSKPFPDVQAREHYLDIARAKVIGAASVASLELDPTQLIDGWKKAGKDDTFRQQLSTLTGDAGQIDGLWSGWLDDGPYLEGQDPEQLRDNDHDGLPNFIEAAISSDPTEVDTDEDGWTDFGEFLLDLPFDNRSKHPGQIVADGHFGDWQELLPTRIRPHNSSVEPDLRCTQEAKIQASAGISNKSNMVLAVLPQAQWLGNTPLSWEFQVDFGRSERNLIFRMVAGGHEIQVIDADNLTHITSIPQAVPFSYRATEVHIDLALLGLTDDLSRPRAVKYRITSLLNEGEGSVCDQTTWAFPLSGQN